MHEVERHVGHDCNNVAQSTSVVVAIAAAAAVAVAVAVAVTLEVFTLKRNPADNSKLSSLPRADPFLVPCGWTCFIGHGFPMRRTSRSIYTHRGDNGDEPNVAYLQTIRTSSSFKSSFKPTHERLHADDQDSQT